MQFVIHHAAKPKPRKYPMKKPTGRGSHGNELAVTTPVPYAMLPTATATDLIIHLIIRNAEGAIPITPRNVDWIEGVENGR
jgi:hypothetical protein